MHIEEKNVWSWLRNAIQLWDFIDRIYNSKEMRYIYIHVYSHLRNIFQHKYWFKRKISEAHKGLNYLLVKICNKQAISVSGASQVSTAEIGGAIMATQEDDPDQSSLDNFRRKNSKASVFLFLFLSEIPISTVITITWKSYIARVPKDNISKTMSHQDRYYYD